MTALKRIALVLTLGVLIVIGIFVTRAENIPTPPLPDLLELDWGMKEPLKKHTTERADDVTTELQGDGQ
jgi:hypothetical protein